MRNLKFDTKSEKSLGTVLCLGAHSDDIEIGCGGALLRLFEEYPESTVWWIVFSGNTSRQAEAQASADRFLAGMNRKHTLLKDFQDGFFPYQGREIKTFFEELKGMIDPDLVFTHYRQDLHQDHRLINELTWNTWRGHMILEYEIPKFDGDMGVPNFYVPLERRICEQKNRILTEVFDSQGVKPWFTQETFWALLHLRGIECRAAKTWLKPFNVRKVVL